MITSIKVCEDCQSPFISAKLVRQSGFDPRLIEAECSQGHSVFFIAPAGGQQFWPVYSDWQVHTNISYQQTAMDLVV